MVVQLCLVVVLHLMPWETLIIISTLASTAYIPTSSIQGSPDPFGLGSIFDFVFLMTRIEMESPCSFSSHCPDGQVFLLHMFIVCLDFIYGNLFLLFFSSFLIGWLVFGIFKSYSCILNTCTLSVILVEMFWYLGCLLIHLLTFLLIYWISTI